MFQLDKFLLLIDCYLHQNKNIVNLELEFHTNNLYHEYLLQIQKKYIDLLYSYHIKITIFIYYFL